MAGENFELYSLTSKLTLDASQFDRVYGESRKKMVTLADDFKRIETASHGLGTKITQTLRPSLGGLQTSITGLGGPLDSTIGKMSSMADVGSKLTLTTSGLGLGLGIVATAGLAAAGGIFALTKKAAEAGDEIFDLTQKVNFSAETISALKNEGQLAGVEFQSLSASLGIFNKNVELANEGDKRLSGAFKALNINLSDNETALRQTFKELLSVRNESQQVALAMEIFGKSGKDVLGVIKSMNGDIDAAIDKFRKMGSLITTDSAKAANDFSDKLKMLEQRFDGVTRSIGERFMPMVSDALDKVSNAMDQNSQHAQTWADDVVAATEFMAAQVKHILEGLAIVMEGYRKTFGKGSFFGDAIEGETKPRMLSIGGNKIMNLKTREVFTVDDQGNITGGTGYQDLGIQVRGGDTGEYAIAGGAGEYSVGAGPGTSKKTNDRLDITRGGGGGGGKGEDPAKIAQQVAKLKLDATLAGLKAEQDANKRSLDLRREDFNAYATQYMVIENRRHEAVLAGLDAEQRAAEKLKKGKDVALQEIANKRAAEATEHETNRNRVLDERGRILDQIDKFLTDQERDINALTGSTDKWDQAYQQLVDTLKEEGVELEPNTRKRIEANIARARELELILQTTRARVVANATRDRFVTKEGKERPAWIDLGGGSTVGGEPATTERPRVATVDEIVKREKAAIRRERVTEIATDLTVTIGDAIEEGFRHGVKAGIEEFEIGILQMLKSAALNALEKRIEKILGGGQNSDDQGGGSGGGLWSTIAHFGIAALGALFGGGGAEGGAGTAAAGAIGGFAGGGYVPPDTWYWRGEHGPELAKSGPHGDSVMSHSDSMAFAGAMAGGGGMNVNIYAQDVSAAFSRQTMTQVKSKLKKLQRGR